MFSVTVASTMTVDLSSTHQRHGQGSGAWVSLLAQNIALWLELGFASPAGMMESLGFLSGSLIFHKYGWRKKWQPIAVFLPGKSHGPRSVVGYSPWGCQELDRT